jgi:TrpR-related protein YerC/YecD
MAYIIFSNHPVLTERLAKMAKNTRKDRSTALYQAVLDLRDADEARRFFEDLCSPTEQRSMEQRFDVAMMLLQNKVYTEILEKTGTSSATISRVRRNIIDKESGSAMKDIILRKGMAGEARKEE